MFAITADQRGSRTHADLVPAALEAIAQTAEGRILLPPDRTAGDEIQVIPADAHAALDISLMLTRTGEWSVGIGAGRIETPLPAETRAARGSALVSARAAVERAKDASTRIAVEGERAIEAEDAEAFLRLLVDLRDRRTDQGWEVSDLLATGIAQKEIAERLGITAPAVSMRVRTAGLRLEESAIPAITRALARLDRVGGP